MVLETVSMFIAVAAYILPWLASILCGGAIGLGIFASLLLKYNLSSDNALNSTKQVYSNRLDAAVSVNRGSGPSPASANPSACRFSTHPVPFLCSVVCVALLVAVIILQVVVTADGGALSAETAGWLGVYSLKDSSGLGVASFVLSVLGAVLQTMTITCCSRNRMTKLAGSQTVPVVLSGDDDLGAISPTVVSPWQYVFRVLAAWFIFLTSIAIGLLQFSVLTLPYYMAAVLIVAKWGLSRFDGLITLHPLHIQSLRVYSAACCLVGFAFQVSSRTDAGCELGDAPVTLGIVCDMRVSDAWRVHLSYAAVFVLHLVAGSDIVRASQRAFQSPPGKAWTTVMSYVASGVGFGLLSLLIMCWTTTFPSLLTLVPMGYVLWRGLFHRRLTSYTESFTGVPYLVTIMVLIALGKYIAFAIVRFQFAALFDPSSISYVSEPYDDDRVQAWYPGTARALGLFPAGSDPAAELVFMITVIVSAAFYHRCCITYNNLPAKRVVDASNGLDKSLMADERSVSPLAEDDAEVGVSRMAACKDRLFAILSDFVTFLQGYAALVALVVLYVLALSHVDLIHATYLIFLVVFASFPNVRRKYWWYLVLFCTLAILVMFIWDVLAFALIQDRGTITDVPPWIIGPDITNPAVDLWHSTYVTNVAIFVFSVLQRPQYEKELDGSFDVELKEFYSKHAWVAKIERWLRSVQLEYGIWVSYFVFLSVALIPPVDIMSLITLSITAVLVTSHISVGVRQTLVSVAALRRASRLLLIMAAFQSAFLAARYLYQFQGIANAVDDIVNKTIADVLPVIELGLECYVNDNYTGNLYINLFDTVSVLVIAILQRRAADSAIAELQFSGAPSAQSSTVMVSDASSSQFFAAYGKPELVFISAVGFFMGCIFIVAGWSLDAGLTVSAITIISGSLILIALSTVSSKKSWIRVVVSRWVGFLRPFWIHNAALFYNLCLCVMIVSLPDGMSALHLLVMLASLTLSSLFSNSRCMPQRSGGVFLQWYLSVAFFFAKYVYQFSFFAASGGHWYSGGSLDAEWFGLYRLDHSAADPPNVQKTPDYAAFWALLGPHISLMIFCILAVWAADYAVEDASSTDANSLRVAALALEGLIEESTLSAAPSPSVITSSEKDEQQVTVAALPTVKRVVDVLLTPHGRHITPATTAAEDPYTALQTITAARQANNNNIGDTATASVFPINYDVVDARESTRLLSGIRKTIHKYRTGFLRDAAVISLVLAAAALLNVWSIVFAILAVVLLVPVGNPDAQQHIWQQAPSGWIKTFVTIAGSRAVWIGALLIQLFCITVLYAECVGWYPALTFWTELWPWNQPVAVQYFYGLGLNGFGVRLPGMGNAGYVYLLLPLLLALHFTAASLMIRSHTNTTAGGQQQPTASTQASDTAANESDEEIGLAEGSSNKFEWDRWQTICIRFLPFILFSALFLSASDQTYPTLIAAGYMAWALYALCRPNAIAHADGYIMIGLRVYNLVVLFAYFVFQAPEIDDGKCAYGSLVGCVSWNDILGLHKFDIPAVPRFALNTTVITPPVVLSLHSPFVPSFALLCITTILAYLLDSTAFHFVRLNNLHADKLAASRRLLTEKRLAAELKQSRLQNQQNAIIMQAKLDRLVHWVARMDLSDSKKGNAHLNVWAPPPPQNVTVEQHSSKTIRITWEPPEGYSVLETPPQTPSLSDNELLSPKTTYRALRAKQQADDESVPSASTLRYIVLMNQVGTTIFGNFERVRVTSKGECETVVDNLQPGELYEFRVAAVNSVGIGTYSPVTLPIKLQMTAASSPQNQSLTLGGAAKRDSVVSLVMLGHEDTRECCGCGDGLIGWWLWLFSGWENFCCSCIDRIVFTQAPTLWDRSLTRSKQRIWPILHIAHMCKLMVYALASHTQVLVVAAIIAENLAYASLVSSVLAVYLFVYLITEYPRPGARAWSFCLGYAVIIVALKFLFQLPIFCLQVDSKDVWHPHLWYSCTQAGVQAATALKYVQPVILFGIYKYTPEYGGDGFLHGIIYDLLVIASLLIHRAMLQHRGMWNSKRHADAKLLEAAIVAKGGLASDAKRETAELLGRERSTDSSTIAAVSKVDHMEIATLAGLPHLDSGIIDVEGEQEVKEEEYPIPAPEYTPQPYTQQLKHFRWCGPSHGQANPSYWMHRSCLHRALRAVLPYGAYMSFIRVSSGTRTVVEKDGRDLYVYTFLCQFIILLVTIGAFGSITEYSGAAESVSEQLAYNQFSGNMVLVVLALIVLMVFDRVAYLLRANWLKLLLHLGCIIAVHVSVFYLVPTRTGRTFISNGALITFYLLWVAYFIIGGLQLHFGFSVAPRKDSLKSSGYTPINTLVFNIYLAIPFLHELRQMLDWVCTKTSLDLNQWMKLEAIQCLMFSVQADMIARKRAHITYAGKAPQGFCYKFWSGFCVFIALLVVILAPALIFSTLNPALSNNFVTTLQTQLNLRGPTGSYELFSSSQLYALASAGNAPGQPDYFSQLSDNATIPGQPSPLNPDWESLAQQEVFYTFPNAEWDPSPPALQNLLTLLNTAANGTVPVFVDLTYQFTRPGPVGQQIASSQSSIPLPPASCAILANDIALALNSAPMSNAAPSLHSDNNVLGATIGNPVVLPNLYPLVLRLPATANPVPLGSMMRTVQLVLHMGNNSANGDQSYSQPRRRAVGAHPYAETPLWWTLSIDDSDPFRWSTKTGLIFNTISDKVAPAVVQALGGYSILALYVTVVLAIGRLVRSGFGVDVSSIPFNELPDCTEIIELCEGIRAAQRATYEGHLIDEMHLYRVLLRLLRSPETLYKICKDKEK